MAEYLEQRQWRPLPKEAELTSTISGRRLNRHPPRYDIPVVSIARVHSLLKEFHAHKAPGPDYLEAELFKHLPDIAVQILADHLNHWIQTGDIDTEQLKARVAALLKQGDFKNAEHYRPISLLNTIY